jgi:heme A synthase
MFLEVSALSERYGKIGLIGLAFIALCGFIGLLAVAFGFLNHDWFALIFGAMTGAAAAVGMSMILVSAKPEKKPETEQPIRE